MWLNIRLAEQLTEAETARHVRDVMFEIIQLKQRAGDYDEYDDGPMIMMIMM